MRVLVSTSIAKGFNTMLREAPKLGFKEIELTKEYVTEENLRTVDRLSKIEVSSLLGDIKNYRYYLFLAQSLNVDFLGFKISKEDLKRMPRVLAEAKNLGQRIAIVNNSKDEGFPCTVKDLKRVVEMGAYILLDTARAKTVTRDLKIMVNSFKDEIAGVYISDYFQGFGHIPVGMGELSYLEPVLKAFGKTKTPHIIKLKDNYSLIDAWISKENLLKYYKGMPKV